LPFGASARTLEGTASEGVELSAEAPQLDRAARPIGEQDEELHELFERYARPLERFCLRELGNREEAEDAVQTTFLNAFRAFRRGVRPDLEAAWLYAIAANVCRSRRRSFFRRRRVVVDDDLHALEDVIAAPQALETEVLIGLGDALAAMPENQRNAILLREWQGLSYAEIAAEMNLSNAAVETLIFRARRSLAKGLEAEPTGRRRLAGGFNLGSLATGLKGLLGGAGAAKLVAAGGIAIVATLAAAPIVHHTTPAPAAPVRRAPGMRAQGTTPAGTGLPLRAAPRRVPLQQAAGATSVKPKRAPRGGAAGIPGGSLGGADSSGSASAPSTSSPDGRTTGAAPTGAGAPATRSPGKSAQAPSSTQSHGGGTPSHGNAGAAPKPSSGQAKKSAAPASTKSQGNAKGNADPSASGNADKPPSSTDTGTPPATPDQSAATGNPQSGAPGQAKKDAPGAATAPTDTTQGGGNGRALGQDKNHSAS
jgi:RNA polymerase sigma factor (sigma-70 family)